MRRYVLVDIIFAFFCIAKAFWSSMIQIAWAFAGIFLTIALFTYYKMSAANLSIFFDIIYFVRDKWVFFFLVIFFFEFYNAGKELGLLNKTKGEFEV